MNRLTIGFFLCVSATVVLPGNYHASAIEEGDPCSRINVVTTYTWVHPNCDCYNRYIIGSLHSHDIATGEDFTCGTHGTCVQLLGVRTENYPSYYLTPNQKRCETVKLNWPAVNGSWRVCSANKWCCITHREVKVLRKKAETRKCHEKCPTP